MFLDFPIIIESITDQLFSITALTTPSTERRERAHAIEAKLTQRQERLKEVSRPSPTSYRDSSADDRRPIGPSLLVR